MENSTAFDTIKTISGNDLRNFTLAHWDKEDYINDWIAAITGGEETFVVQMDKVAAAKGVQAQGKGLYLLRRPDNYSPKPDSNCLMVVRLVAVPYYDASSNPKDPDPLKSTFKLDKDGVYAIAKEGHPPPLLLQYGSNFFRLTTAKGVEATKDLRDISTEELDDWRKRLWILSDKTGFHALKTQADQCGMDVSGW